MHGLAAARASGYQAHSSARGNVEVEMLEVDAGQTRPRLGTITAASSLRQAAVRVFASSGVVFAHNDDAGFEHCGLR